MWSQNRQFVEVAKCDKRDRMQMLKLTVDISFSYGVYTTVKWTHERERNS